MSHVNSLQLVISAALKTLHTETLFRADPQGGFLLNAGEPGLVETLRGLSARMASKSPGPGRKPIVAHANHMLFSLSLVDRVVQGDEQAFQGVDWDKAWRLETVTDPEWANLLNQLESTARRILKAVPEHHDWNEVMLTGAFGCAAHTAYHLGAIRQILRDVEQHDEL